MTAEPPDGSPDELLSCQEVAVRYGISNTHLRALALMRGVGRDIGGGELMFNPADVAALQPRRSGRPWEQQDPLISVPE